MINHMIYKTMEYWRRNLYSFGSLSNELRINLTSIEGVILRWTHLIAFKHQSFFLQSNFIDKNFFI